MRSSSRPLATPLSAGSAGSTFPSLPSSPDLPALELDVLTWWADRNIFQRSLEQTATGEPWVFFEGPPTANGAPGAHHVEPRAFKDLFCRYRTMTGRRVVRKAGWDCHGLPVELAVEKELGFTSKQDIEAFGIAAFNDRCRESVLRHVGDFERMSERMGYWLDYADAYRTMDPAYIESVWWSLKTIHDRGLLVEDHRVSPYCPRCQTALSDHEVAQGYTEVVDPSVYVRLPVLEGPLAALGADLLIWTTTPWTLVSNTAVAVHPETDYVVATTSDGAPVVIAESLRVAVLGEESRVLEHFTGQALEHTRYSPPLDVLAIPEPAHQVVLATYVTTVDGTGLVHQAPAFGAEDLQVARRYGLPVVNPIGADGCFQDNLALVGGAFFKTADEVIVRELERRGVLYRYLPYRHTYPLCWRCDTALLYYALPSWYVRTTAIAPDLLAQNAATDWHPANVREGRYGDWLANNVDWALSRNRYWGTPLPIWRCGEGHLQVIGSLAELGQAAGRDLTDLDPHRPYVDDVVLTCPQCPPGSPAAHRVPEVIDCWYDSGAMPFAQWGAPHQAREEFENSYPAHFIAEAIDQTRGWFYTLMAIGTAVYDQSPYRTVLCLGHIVDGDGRKMSKHLGNVLDPFDLFDTYGADAVRWLMLATGNPWSARRVSAGALEEVVRKVLLTAWNTASFLTLYADAAGWRPSAADPEPSHVLDRWLAAETAAVARDVAAALDCFDSVRGGRRLATFLADLSNWYVRRSRRRFWEGDPAALAALHSTLLTVARLLAPFTPFLAEQLWHALRTDPASPESVHLTTYPGQDATDIADTAALTTGVNLARRLVELGRAARSASGVRTRQPLGVARITAADLSALPDGLADEVAAELNVAGLEALASELIDVVVRPNFRELGRRFGSRTPEVAAQVDASRYDRESGTLRVRLGKDEVELSGTDLIVTETPREGWSVSTGEGSTVVLDLTVTPALRRAGIAREVVRQVQDARKQADLLVTDRIELWWDSPDPDVATALLEHAAAISGEVLAVSFLRGGPAAPLAVHRIASPPVTFWLRGAGG